MTVLKQDNRPIWTHKGTIDQLLAHPEVRDLTGDQQPFLMAIPYLNGNLCLIASRRPQFMLRQVLKNADAAQTVIGNILISTNEPGMSPLREVVQRRLKMAGYRYVGRSMFVNTPVSAVLAIIREIFPGEHGMNATQQLEVLAAETQEAKIDNAPTVFNFESHQVRMVTRDDGEPWFVAADVCDALGLENSRDATKRLDDDEKGVGSIDTLGGAQDLTVINESGLYSLILGSRKPEAKKFKKWVTSEVLPAIRKSGSYSTEGPANAQPQLDQNPTKSPYWEMYSLAKDRAWQLAVEKRDQVAALVGQDMMGHLETLLPALQKKIERQLIENRGDARVL